MIYILCSVALGISLTFYGERRFSVLTAASAFMISGLLLFANLYPGMPLTTACLISVFSAAIIAVLSFYFSVIRRFLFGAFLGSFIAVAVLLFFTKNLSAWYCIAIIVLSGIVLGVLSIFYDRALSVISTSFVGAFISVSNAMLLTISFGTLVYIYNTGGNCFRTYLNSLLSMIAQHPSFFMIAIAVLGVSGILVQFLMSPHKGSTKKHK